MFYLYFSFAVLAAVGSFFLCRQAKLSIWLVPMVLLAPVTMPYVIFRARKKQGLIPFVIFMVLMVTVCVGEGVIWSNQKEAKRIADIPPLTRQLLDLCDTLKQSNIEVNQGLLKLESISQTESTAQQLGDTLTFVQELREILAANRDAIRELLEFADNHRTYLDRKGLGWVYQLKEFYTHPRVTRMDKSLEIYLDHFEQMLNYAYTYIYEISEIFEPAYMKNYDQYYIRYRRAVDQYIAYNSDRIHFQSKFMEGAPDILDYLPGPCQAQTFHLPTPSAGT